MRRVTTALLAFGLGWASAAWAAPPPAATEPPAEAPDEGYLEDLPPLPPLPPPPAAPDQLQQEWRYNGPHAIHADVGGGWCDQAGPHVHPYPPFDDQLFQEDNGGYDFLGDPTDFGYQGGDLSWYEDDHPIAAGWGFGWCYMTWPHRHRYRPDGRYAACGGYWCYNGVRDPSYWREWPRWAHYWSRYPHHYWAGEYFRTHRAASPGRWAAIHPRPGRSVGPGATSAPRSAPRSC